MVENIFSFLVWTVIEYRFKAYVVSLIFLNIYFLDTSVAEKEDLFVFLVLGNRDISDVFYNFFVLLFLYIPVRNADCIYTAYQCDSHCENLCDSHWKIM